MRVASPIYAPARKNRNDVCGSLFLLNSAQRSAKADSEKKHLDSQAGSGNLTLQHYQIRCGWHAGSLHYNISSLHHKFAATRHSGFLFLMGIRKKKTGIHEEQQGL